MKKTKILWVLPAIITSLSLSGCSKILSLFQKNVEVVSLDKKQLSYTYSTLANHNFYEVDATPNTGSPKLLVVPVWFTDSSAYISASNKAAVHSHIEKAYFGTEDDTGWHSVKTYYQELSHNIVNLTGVVTEWYECGQSSRAFYSEDAGGENTMKLVNNAVNWYKTNSGDSSMSSFDVDNNGYLDGVVLIYGAPDYGALKNNDASNLWAYCYWMQQARGTETNPVANVFFWASYDFIYGKDNGFSNYASGDTSYCKLDTHTYIHETGHMFGLDDYYDYSNKYSPAGGFSMQDYNVGSHDPYSVMALGWAKPMIPDSTCALSLKPFQTNHDLVLLKNPNNKSLSPFDEYFLVEFYTPTGLNSFDTAHKYSGQYPQGPNKYGIRLWHVDARLVEAPSRENLENMTITNSINFSKYYDHAMSNTYYSDRVADYTSPLGRGYADFNILQLIRNSKTATYKPTGHLSSNDLFYKGDTFKMSTYSKQFVNTGKLNTGEDFRWSFKVNSISLEEAIITLTLS